MEKGNVFSLFTLGGGGNPRYLPPTPSEEGTTPLGQVRMGVERVPQGTYPLLAKVGNPPPLQDRTAYGVLATQRAVCLLRSRRRTVLFIV